MKYKVKPCVENDADFIWEKDAAEGRSIVPVQAGEEEKLVFAAVDAAGALIGGCVLDIDLLKNAEFERLWVDEPYRRRGIGSALIREAERAARERGCRVILNAYNFDFQQARPLFEKHGYRLVGVARDWPRGHECYRLLKRLDDPAKEVFSFGAAPAEIRPGREEEGAFIAGRLEAYNNAIAPRSHPYLDLDKKLVDDGGNIIAGCIAGVSGWNAAHIDLIWVAEAYRDQGLDAYLLGEIEREARENGAYLARTTAPTDLQAAFFKRHGYTANGESGERQLGYDMQKRL